MITKKKITKTYSIEENIFNRFDEICRQKNINRSKFIEQKINLFILENWSIDQNKMYSLPGSEDYVKIINTKVEDGYGYVTLSNGNKLKLDDFEKIYTEEVVDPENFLDLNKYKPFESFKDNDVDEYIKNDEIDDISQKVFEPILNSDILLPINELNMVNKISVELGGESLNTEVDQIDPSFLNSGMLSINDIEKIKEIMEEVDIEEHLQNRDWLNNSIKINNNKPINVTDDGHKDSLKQANQTMDKDPNVEIWVITSLDQIKKRQLVHKDDESQIINYDFWKSAVKEDIYKILNSGIKVKSTNLAMNNNLLDKLFNVADPEDYLVSGKYLVDAVLFLKQDLGWKIESSNVINNWLFKTTKKLINDLQKKKMYIVVESEDIKKELTEKYEFTEDLKSIRIKESGKEYKLVDLYNIKISEKNPEKLEIMKFAMTHSKVKEKYFTNSKGEILF